jgi:PAS domain S-box-containing protein
MPFSISTLPANRKTRPEIRIVLLYLALGGAWIVFSDELVTMISRGRLRTDLSILKGWFFVAVAAVIFYYLIKKSQKALVASEQRYRAVVEDQTEVITRYLPDGTYTFVNDVYCRMFGKTRDGLIGTRWQPIAHPDDLWLIETRLKEMSPEHTVVVIENRVYSANGEVRWMQFVNRGFFDDDGQLVESQAVGRDITERKKAEEALRGYAHRLLTLEEEMRRKLAAELHDEIGRDLTALGLTLAMVNDALPEQPREQLFERLGDARSTLEIISRRIRSLMAKLRPPVLDDYGLPAALRWHCDLFSKQVSIKVDLSVDDSFPRLSSDRELALFRITQEALTNVTKHAMAGRVFVALACEGARIRLSVRDDGAGFDAAKAFHRTDTCGWGLTIMRERAEAVGGIFLLETAPGRGATIAVELGRDE